MQYFRLF